jgi:GrpB-like predicted nucleotidyltransferase (UPF0157 family)
MLRTVNEDTRVVYLVSGPAAGRTAVVRQLAVRLDGVHLGGDPELTAAAADEHFAAGSSVVVEDAGPARLLGEYRAMIRSRPCHVVVLFDAAETLDDEVPRVGIWIETTALTPDGTVDEILARTPSVREPLVVVDYDEAWPAWFDELAGPLREALGDLGAEVEHVGSTAVPGLAAKPIIDVDVAVRSAEDVPIAIERLRRLGYVYQGDKGIPGREAFLWPPGARRHHLYVVVAGSEPHTAHIRFRDHLRANPEIAARYAALKKELAVRHADDPLVYTDAKSEFVSRHRG